MTDLKQAKSFKEADFLGSDTVSELPMAKAVQFEQADFGAIFVIYVFYANCRNLRLFAP